MKRLANQLTGTLAILTPFWWGAATALAKPADTLKNVPAFEVKQQVGPLETSQPGMFIMARVGQRTVVKLPFDVASASYVDGQIAMIHADGERNIAIEGKKVGHTEIAVWMKRGPQRPIIMAVNVLEAWVTPKFGASTGGASSASGKVGVSTSGPYKKPFPIREQEPVAVSPGSVQAMSIDTNSYQELIFPSEIIDVGYSDGGIVGAFAIHNRALALTGIAPGQIELFIRTRRFESDEVGQIQRYSITVVKAAPEAPVLWKEREKTLKAEIKKQDARILELEKELARRNG